MRGCLVPLALLLPAVALAASARGPNSVALPLKALHVASGNELKSDEPAVLWLAPDHRQMTITSTTCHKASGDRKSFTAKISADKKNSTIEISNLEDRGRYNCRMVTSHGQVTYDVDVNLKPTAIVSSSYTSKSDEKNTITAPALYVADGDPFNISCSVIAYPSAHFKWTKDKKQIEMSNTTVDGQHVRVEHASQAHAGTYTCEAVNEYAEGGRKVKKILLIEHEIQVKSPYSWIYPAILIVAILVLLVIVIVLCEMRRKRLERSTRYVAQE